MGFYHSHREVTKTRSKPFKWHCCRPLPLENPQLLRGHYAKGDAILANKLLLSDYLVHYGGASQEKAGACLSLGTETPRDC